MKSLQLKAEQYIRDILTLSIQHASCHQAMVVYDGRSELSQILSESYRQALPLAVSIDFDSVTPQFILKEFEKLKPNDLVVLIQSTSFRLEAFRIRVELFKRGIKVIEHPHLGRMQGEEIACYVDALEYDAEYYRGVGGRLKEKIDKAKTGAIDSGGARLVFSSEFESAKLNVGDYLGMKNIGGQFPIGEVFTEAKNLDAVNGSIRIFAFADVEFRINKPKSPITLVVEKSKVISTHDSVNEFEKVLDKIRADEGEVWVRELGFGMNRAFTPERRVCDVGTYERMCGIHLSLGAKHAVYKKPGFSRSSSKHHVDVFAVTEGVYLDDQKVFENGGWRV